MNERIKKRGKGIPRSNNRDREIGLRLRKFRMALGISQMVVAKDVGVSYQMVQRHEQGHGSLAASRLEDYANALGVTVGDILATNTTITVEDADFDFLVLYNKFPHSLRASIVRFMGDLEKEL